MYKYAFIAALLSSTYAFSGNFQPMLMDYQPAEQASRATVFADFLWWKADVEATEVALFNTITITDGTVNVSHRTLTPTAKWEPGVRVGIGYRPNPCDTMDISATWTYLNTHSNRICVNTPTSSSYLSSSSLSLTPLTLTYVGPTASSVRADWKLNTNLLDVEIGKAYFPSCSLSLKPHVGVRGAWFKFDFDQRFVGVWRSFESLDEPESIRIETHDTAYCSKFTYSGAGLKIGTDANWNFKGQWSILAKLSGSLLYGKYDTRQLFDGYLPDPLLDGFPALVPLTSKYRDDFWRVRTNLEGFLGVMWETTLSQFNLGLSLGYEISQWYQLNSLPLLENVVSIYPQFNGTTQETSFNFSNFEHSANGDISYQGLTLRASIGF